MSNMEKIANKFCKCIKHVRKTVKLRKGQKRTKTQKESAAIGICVQSVLQKKRRKTLKKFRCGKKPMLIMQNILH
jgi:hypothetical protein